MNTHRRSPSLTLATILVYLFLYLPDLRPHRLLVQLIKDQRRL